MHIELFYLLIAFVASVAILFFYGWNNVKIMLQQQIVCMSQEHDLLLLELDQSKKLHMDILNAYQGRKEKCILLEKSFPNLLKEQYQKCEEKNAAILKDYKTWCRKHFIEEYKHREEVLLKQLMIDKVIDRLEKILITEMDSMPDTTKQLLQAYEKYARI